MTRLGAEWSRPRRRPSHQREGVKSPGVGRTPGSKGGGLEGAGVAALSHGGMPTTAGTLRPHAPGAHGANRRAFVGEVGISEDAALA